MQYLRVDFHVLHLTTSGGAPSELQTGDTVVATAILDRLLHHSHVLMITGESFRLREKRRTGLRLSAAPSGPAAVSRADRWIKQIGSMSPTPASSIREIEAKADR